MRATFNIKLHHIPKKTGEYSVLLKITKDRQIKSVTLPITVRSKNHFNPKGSRGKWVRQADESYSKKNSRILKRLEQFEDAYDELVGKGVNPTLQMIVSKADNRSSGSIIEYADKQTALYNKNGQINYAKHYKSVFKKLGEYIKLKKCTDLSFDEIDVTFLRDYEAYLNSIGNNKNTIAKNFRIIRATFYNAARESIISSENIPFHLFKIKGGRTYNKALSLEELGKLIDADITNESPEWNVRNYFLFSFYCAGIRISDLIQLKWGNIEDNGSEIRLLYTMSKNGKHQNIKLSDKAIKIIALYKKEKTKSDDFLFPILKDDCDYKDKKYLFNQISSKNTIINKHLKSLAIKAKISTNISFHVARHTFSDLARQKGHDIYKIKELLKHSNIKETEGYLATLDQRSADNVLDTL